MKKWMYFNCFCSFSSGNPCPYIVDDPNEDTISILVRLITEKKGVLYFPIYITHPHITHWDQSLIASHCACVLQKMQLLWKNFCRNMRINKWPSTRAHPSSKIIIKKHFWKLTPSPKLILKWENALSINIS